MVGVTDSVLVVIDMQNGFVKPASAYVVPRVVDLVQRWQDVGGATIFTRFFNSPGSAYERLIEWTDVATAPETDIVAELQPYADRATAVIDKPGYTLFTPEGAAAVEAGGWRNMLVCGLTVESCVCKTAVDAFERDLIPWVITDATGTHAGELAHNAGLLVIRRFIGAGQLITTKNIDLPMAATQNERQVQDGTAVLEQARI
jgi:nicotinamidase-related amidase